MGPCLPALRRVLGLLDSRFVVRSSMHLTAGMKATSERRRNLPQTCPRLRQFVL